MSAKELGGDISSWLLDETLTLLMRGDKRFDFESQPFITVTGAGQKTGSLRWIARQSRMNQLINLSRTFGSHDSQRSLRDFALFYLQLLIEITSLLSLKRDRASCLPSRDHLKLLMN